MGPITHKTAMSSVSSIAKSEFNINLTVGSFKDNLAPDIIGTHENWQYQLKEFLPIVSKKFQLRKDVSYEMRTVCHFLLDYHSITQIMSGSTFLKDSIIDTWAETVSNKDSYSIVIPSYDNWDKFIIDLNNSINKTITIYAANARKWNFIFTASAKDMVRRAVQKATEFSLGYLMLAYKMGEVK